MDIVSLYVMSRSVCYKNRSSDMDNQTYGLDTIWLALTGSDALETLRILALDRRGADVPRFTEWTFIGA